MSNPGRAWVSWKRAIISQRRVERRDEPAAAERPAPSTRREPGALQRSGGEDVVLQLVGLIEHRRPACAPAICKKASAILAALREDCCTSNALDGALPTMDGRR